MVKNTLIIFFINAIKNLRNLETMGELFDLLNLQGEERESLKEMLEDCCIEERIQTSLKVKY